VASSSPHGGWAKSPPDLVERFEAATAPLLTEPGVERRQMFGYPACFVGGNMFTGLHQDRWVVRLADDDLAALAQAGGTPFEPMPGRAMTGFMTLPPALAEPKAVRRWLERALARGRSLPPKTPKPRRAGRSKPAGRSGGG
jgi:TfoX/Sxy family transcriptional regulator of competence genes